MSDVIVVPEETAESGSEGVAFAAGLATAEAAQAGEEAEEAAAVAEVAAEEAAGAVVVAESAASAAWAARDDVDQLRAQFTTALDEIRGMVADLAVPAESELTPERVERENGPAPEGAEGEGGEEDPEPKNSRGRYGNAKWFGR